MPTIDLEMGDFVYLSPILPKVKVTALTTTGFEWEDIEGDGDTTSGGWEPFVGRLGNVRWHVLPRTP
jgi:hypothetical protein